MRKILLASCLLFPLSASAGAYITASASYYSIKEVSEGQTLDTEKGFLPNIGIGYAFEDFVLNLDYADGTIAYDGHLQDGTPHTTNTKTKLIDLTFVGRLPIESAFNLYAGVGYSKWDRDIQDKDGDQSGLHEIYTNKTVVLEADYPTDNALFKIGYRLHFDAEMAIDITHYDAKGTFGLPSSHELMIGYDHKLSPNLVLFTDFRYQKVKESGIYSIDDSSGNSVAYGLEPEHTVKRLSLGIHYGF